MFNRQIYNKYLKLNSKIKDLVVDLSDEKLYCEGKIIPVKLPAKNKIIWEGAHSNDTLYSECMNSFIFKVNKDVKGWDGHMIVSSKDNEYLLKFINIIDLNKWKYEQIYGDFIFDKIDIFKNFIKMLF